MQEYADPVIDWLDAGRGILSRRMFREVRILASGHLFPNTDSFSRSPALSCPMEVTLKT
jgi:hypothetical protein